MSMFGDILDAVKDVLDDLSLTGVIGWTVREVPSDSALTRPAGIISPMRRVEDAAAGVLSHDDNRYSVLARIVAADNREQDDAATYATWQETVAKAFHNKPLSAVAGVYTCRAQSGDLIPLAHWQNNCAVIDTVLTFTAREARA